MKRLILAIMLCVAFAGCTNFEKNAYATLESVQAVYDAGMSTAADMRVNGHLSQEQWDDIADIAIKVSASGATASKAMEVYSQLPTEDKMSQAKEAIKLLYDQAEFFVEQIEKVTGKELPVALKMLI